jgi:hypothetical protein
MTATKEAMMATDNVTHYVTELVQYTGKKGAILKKVPMMKGFVRMKVDPPCKWTAYEVEPDSQADKALTLLSVHRLEARSVK